MPGPAWLGARASDRLGGQCATHTSERQSALNGGPAEEPGDQTRIERIAGADGIDGLDAGQPRDLRDRTAVIDGERAGRTESDRREGTTGGECKRRLAGVLDAGDADCLLGVGEEQVHRTKQLSNPAVPPLSRIPVGID